MTVYGLGLCAILLLKRKKCTSLNEYKSNPNQGLYWAWTTLNYALRFHFRVSNG